MLLAQLLNGLLKVLAIKGGAEISPSTREIALTLRLDNAKSGTTKCPSIYSRRCITDS